MTLVSWIIKTELKQNKLHFLLVAFICTLLGAGTHLVFQANTKISSLSTQTEWEADLAILPKGISLTDFREELLSGTTKSFLPEALFDTTSSIANGLFPLTAFLPYTDETGIHIQTKSSQQALGTEWLRRLNKDLRPWADHSFFSAPEWHDKVVAGILAKGTAQEMKSLKDLIDKKTVAQAIPLKAQQEREQKQQDELRSGLLLYTSVLILLFFLSLLSVYFWIKVPLMNSLLVLHELGFQRISEIKIITGLIAVSSALPFVLGYLLALKIYS